MLGDAIGDLLPAAIAVALSPIPIIAVVVVLGSSHARSSGPAFALGWIAGLALAATAVVLLVSAGADADQDDEGIGWLQLAIGVLFIGLAAKQWRTRPRRGETEQMPAWMATVESASAPRAALLGLTLSGANPKNLALTLATAASVAEAGLDASEETIALAAFVLLGSSTVLGAVLGYLVLGERAAGPLAAVRRFMTDNNTAIMIVVLLLIGAKLIGDGLGGV